jgi:hypothetical protein
MSLTLLPVAPQKVIAIATDGVVKPEHASQDKNLPGPPPKYGQDFTFGVGRAAPGGQDVSGGLPGFVGTPEEILKLKMSRLLPIYAAGDEKKMAKRLFDKFQAKQKQVIYFDDADLNAAAAEHENIQSFCSAALGAPYPFGTPPAPGKTRIHQALKAAGWDIAKITAPNDLRTPAFNRGSKFLCTKDFDNGLGLMIDGIQYVYIVATAYAYDATENLYGIALKFIFYDVFGLDDTDLDSFGAKSDTWSSFDAVGITAWWQLQHQYGYAPLVTRIVLERTYIVPAV